MAPRSVARADRRAVGVPVGEAAAAGLTARSTAAPSGGRAIEARGWGWRHAGRNAWAVRGLDLLVDAGERVLLLGPSGAGKTTLLRAVAGLLDASAGGEMEGVLTTLGAAPSRSRGGTGLVFQDPHSQIILGTAGDDVAFGLENRCVPRDEIWPRVADSLAAVDFPYPLDRSTDRLSGGEKQRLALAGVLAMRPDLLLLDEPTAHLDDQAARAFRTSLAAHLASRRELAMVVVEHRVGEWLPLVDRVVVIEPGGGVVADGETATVFSEHGQRLAEMGVWVPGDTAAPRTPRTGGAELLAAERVGYRYAADAADAAAALEAVDVTVRAGEALGILGANGSGKSTLALLLGGLLKPTRGCVTATELLAPRAGPREPWRWRGRDLVGRIGSVFQVPEHQFVRGRVDEEIAVGPVAAGLSSHEADERATELMRRFGLAHLAAANPFTLSGGEQRRLSVAVALATRPPVLILDEPTFGQDRRTHGEMVAILSELRDAGSAVCVATHDGLLVDALADRTVTLTRGRAA